MGGGGGGGGGKTRKTFRVGLGYFLEPHNPYLHVAISIKRHKYIVKILMTRVFLYFKVLVL